MNKLATETEIQVKTTTSKQNISICIVHAECLGIHFLKMTSR